VFFAFVAVSGHPVAHLSDRPDTETWLPDLPFLTDLLPESLTRVCCSMKVLVAQLPVRVIVPASQNWDSFEMSPTADPETDAKGLSTALEAVVFARVVVWTKVVG
jgi:hypothetical protein